MAEHLRLANTEPPPIEADGFVRTETAINIFQTLTLIDVMDGPQMTMIAGAPGVGKTRAISEFVVGMNHWEFLHLVLKRGEGTPNGVSEALFQKLLPGQGANGKSLGWRREKLLYSGFCCGRLVLVDEAQHLTEDGIEWLRGLAEEGGVSVAFVGDLSLPKLVAAIPPLADRMRLPRRFTASTRGDVAAFVRAKGHHNPEILRLLEVAVAKKSAARRGGLRTVETALALATMFAGGEGIETAHVASALNEMGLLPKGGANDC